MAIYGHRARIGYTCPPALAEVFPRDFYRIAPKGVTLVLSTLTVGALGQGEMDRCYEATLEAARIMAAAKVDLVMLGGSPVNMSQGFGNAESQAARLSKELGVPVTTSVEARLSAYRALGSNKVALVHPFDEGESAHYRENYADFGIDLVGCKAGGHNVARIAVIDEGDAAAWGREILQSHPEADTLFFSAAHFPAIDAIEPLEREFGVNVLSALQVIVWQSLRMCGIDDRIEGFGRLLREF